MANWREKIKASAHGEVSREGLDPYRVAGQGVYEYVMALDDAQRRGAPGVNDEVVLLAGWVAFALQSLGDAMLDADAELDPSTAHYVPAVTAEQVMAFYEPVQAWIARARQAAASPSYSLDVRLPEVLPDWVEVEPCPAAHLYALRLAVGQLQERTEAMLVGFHAGPRYEHAREMIALGAAEAASAVEYANGLWGGTTGRPPASVHEGVEANLKHATEAYFYLGQLIAMPNLADAPRRLKQTQPPERGGSSFLDSIIRSYPQVAERRRGPLSGLGGALLGGLIGGGIIDEILGGGGDGW